MGKTTINKKYFEDSRKNIKELENKIEDSNLSIANLILIIGFKTMLDQNLDVLEAAYEAYKQGDLDEFGSPLERYFLDNYKFE